MIDDYYISEIRILLRFTPYIISNSSKFFTPNIRLNKIKLLIKIFFFAGIYILLWSRYIQDVFRYTLPVLKNCSAITTQRAVTASSSLNVIINNAILPLLRLSKLQCKNDCLKKHNASKYSI